ncbi:SDR family NAD(P)-dependent oxidoreductase [Nocardia sp. NPDC051570]|uniref:SDR family NAD(P)-dependent oxidoreductase n=1 Tax=Nocardia sp. NPDC051570 TaxID=3364324 RepID=UPI0037888450
MGDGRHRVAIVTGAGGSLGAAVVRRLAAREFTIAVVDLRASWCDTSLDAVGPARAGIWAFGADLRFLHEAEATVLRVAEELGPPSMVVNAPFPGRATTSSEVPDWDSVVLAGLRAPLLVSRAAERYLIESGHGRIVNIARTDSSEQPRPEILVVRETLQAMTGTLSQELGPRGVRVNTVLAEIGADDEAAAMVDFLISDAADDISGRMIESRPPNPESSPAAGGVH